MAWSTILQEKRSIEGDRPLQPIILSEEDVGNSKILKMNEVLAGRLLEIYDIRIEYTANGTVGTRKLTFEILDREDDVVYSTFFSPDTDVVASTTENLQLVRTASGFTTAVEPTAGGSHRDLLPILYLGPGDQLKISDRANIAAGDTCVVHIRGNLF